MYTIGAHPVRQGNVRIDQHLRSKAPGQPNDLLGETPQLIEIELLLANLDQAQSIGKA